MGFTLLSIVLLMFAIQGSYGKHFRGGSMSWKPVGNQIQLTYQVGFTVNIGPNDGDPCTPEAQGNEEVLSTSGRIQCDSCSSDDRTKQLQWICDDYDIEADSTYGHYTLLYDIPQNQFDISYESCCWIKLVSPVNTAYGAGSNGWKMLAHVDVGRRSDGRINSSPLSAHIPVEKFYKGCQYKLRIPASDPDNDVVRCRYAKTDNNECPAHGNTKACGPKTNGLKIKTNCILTFDTENIGEGYHAVNVIIEDFERPYKKKTSQPLSKVSLLFLLLVEGESASCMTPTIVDPPLCKTVRPGEHFELIIRADPGEPSKPIEKIKTQKPGGMTSTEMEDDPDVSNRKMVTLSWDPMEEDIGEHPVCFSALDEDGYTSGVECTFIYVDDDPLQADSEHSRPTANEVIKAGETWTVQFTQEIQRPKSSSFIRIVHPDTGNIVFELDATDQSVVFDTSSIDFMPSRDVLLSGANTITIQYKLQLDEGVAMPKMGGCGSEAAEWQVGVEDNKPATQPPPVTRPYKPPTFECKTGTMEIHVPNHLAEEGEECFVHLPEETVVVSGGVINTPYKVCCPSNCGSTVGRPGVAHGPPGFL